jgi:hypothetical protein
MIGADWVVQDDWSVKGIEDGADEKTKRSHSGGISTYDHCCRFSDGQWFFFGPQTTNLWGAPLPLSNINNNDHHYGNPPESNAPGTEAVLVHGLMNGGRGAGGDQVGTLITCPASWQNRSPQPEVTATTTPPIRSQRSATARPVTDGSCTWPKAVRRMKLDCARAMCCCDTVIVTSARRLCCGTF